MGTSNNPTHQAYRNMSATLCGSICVSTTLVSNTLEQRTYNTCMTPSQQAYEIVEDWEGDLYCSILLKWNYAKHYVDLSMAAYVIKQLTQYGHIPPLKPQHCPYAPSPINYGKDNQSPSPIVNSPLLDNAGKKRIQQIVGSFLYYAQAVDPTILMINGII
jgi:hypothetical protein